MLDPVVLDEFNPLLACWKTKETDGHLEGLPQPEQRLGDHIPREMVNILSGVIKHGLLENPL